jgi:hypothetical protein
MQQAGDATRNTVYRRCLELQQKVFDLIDPATTRVAVPFEGTTLPAYFTNASTAGAPGERPRNRTRQPQPFWMCMAVSTSMKPTANGFVSLTYRAAERNPASCCSVQNNGASLPHCRSLGVPVTQGTRGKPLSSV